MTLGEKQELFVELENQWVSWVLSHEGWKLRHGEGRILQAGAHNEGRKARLVSNGQIVKVRDLVHRPNSTHYNGVGVDWLLFVHGVNLTKGDEPEWKECGEKWESMHALCRWGGRFQDANHFSLEHNGVK